MTSITDDNCRHAHVKLAMDTESNAFSKDDGLIPFPPFLQAEFSFVQTNNVDRFATAAKLHLKHRVFVIECVYNTVVSMTQMKTNATSRSVGIVQKVVESGDDMYPLTMLIQKNCTS